MQPDLQRAKSNFVVERKGKYIITFGNLVHEWVAVAVHEWVAAEHEQVLHHINMCMLVGESLLFHVLHNCWLCEKGKKILRS